MTLYNKTKVELIDIINSLNRKIDVMKLENKKEFIIKNQTKFYRIKNTRKWDKELKERVLELRDIKGKPISEICSIMNLSQRQVYSLYGSAKYSLKLGQITLPSATLQSKGV